MAERVSSWDLVSSQFIAFREFVEKPYRSAFRDRQPIRIGSSRFILFHTHL